MLQNERLDRVLEAAATAGLEATLITSDESIAYLTGFKPMQLERFFGVVVRPDRSAVIVPALDRGQIDGAPQRLDRISLRRRIRRDPRADRSARRRQES